MVLEVLPVCQDAVKVQPSSAPVWLQIGEVSAT